MKTIGNKITATKLPFFKKGSLIFKDSRHELELSDRHYRCREHCKSCTGEMQIKKENLERNFSRYAKKFLIEKEEGGIIYEQMMSDYMKVLLEEMSGKTDRQSEIIDSTKAVVKQDLEKGGIKKSNLKILENAYIKNAESMSGLYLLGTFMGAIVNFSNPKSEMEMGRGLSLFAKHVYLSNDGKVLSLEMEKWGWYILHYMNKKIPNYLFELKEKGVRITNKEEDYLRLNFLDAVHHFEKEGLGKAMSDYSVKKYYKFFEEFKKLFVTVSGGDSEEVKKATLMLFERIENDPATTFTLSMAQYL